MKNVCIHILAFILFSNTPVLAQKPDTAYVFVRTVIYSASGRLRNLTIGMEGKRFQYVLLSENWEKVQIGLRFICWRGITA